MAGYEFYSILVAYKRILGQIMEELYIATLIIIFLAVTATILSYLLKISIALVEIIMGIAGGFVIHAWFPTYEASINSSWFTVLASVGALMLTFLAGSELDAEVIKKEGTKAGLIGFVSYLTPFLGCTAVAYYGFGWSQSASWLTGLVLSTTSVAIVYGTLLELGMNDTAYGKSLLTACFVTDFCTVLSLGLIFSPFSFRTILFFIFTAFICVLLPFICHKTFKVLANKPSAFEIKFILLFLVGLGVVAIWAGYEPILPAFFVGIALSGAVGKNHVLIRHLQTVTFGLLTPFYFIRAGFLVSVPVLISSCIPILIFLCLKIFFKGIGVYSAVNIVSSYKKEVVYTALLMSTGLAFGSIAALFGLTHGIINQEKYSLLIAVVVTSAIIPTLIANAFYLPRHLLKVKISV